MSTFLKIIEHQTPDFFHTFTVNFALAPAVLYPLQNGIGNLEMVHFQLISLTHIMHLGVELAF